MDLLSLLLLTIPVFYLLGIIQLLSWILGKRGINQTEYKKPVTDYMKVIIADMELAVKKNPKKTVKQQVEEYKERYNKNAEKIEEKSKELEEDVTLHILQHPSNTSSKDYWSNWYSNNSINLLLYVGAFLIVLSASIFVGFQWGTIPGTVKAGLLTLLAVVFFLCGFIFYAMPKIKNAGYTFVAIGALLIPICSVAWYNFVLKSLSVEIGTVWLLTSLLTISVYLSLAFLFKSRFYTYIASASTLSATLSVVNTFSWETTYYILAGMFSSFFLLVCSLLFSAKNETMKKTVGIPLEVSSNVFMPLALIVGVMIAFNQDKLFTLEASMSVLLGAGFYIVSTVIKRQTWKTAIALILFPVSIVLFCNWQHVTTSNVLSVLDIVGFFYIVVAYFLQERIILEEMHVCLVIGLTCISGIFLYSWISNPSLQTVAFGITGIIAGIFTTLIKKRIQYISVATFFLGPSCYIVFNYVLPLSNNLEYLSLIYLSIAVGYYCFAVYTQRKNDFVMTLGISSVVYIFVSLLFALSNAHFLLIVSIVSAAISYSAATQFKKKKIFVATVIFSYLALFNILRLTAFADSYYIFFFAGFSYFIYFLSFLFTDDELLQIVKSCGLLGSALVPFFAYDFSYASANQPLTELNALISAYGAVVIYGLETALRKTKSFGYITSVFAMITYLWQIHFNGITETLLYTVPIGLYFLVLGYIQKIKQHRENFKVLTIVGLGFLLLAPFLLSFGDEMVKYSITLGACGVALFIAGITINDRYYKYAGITGLILAIIPQTYSYILLLPRWGAVGIIGLVFLVTAVYLLLKRKE